ncbi:hypothetical protein J5J10_05920 [Ciceribacter sp. L1K23]|uniref:hypothetical protein n=1 Tax=unclassified Ciceribacter TaxID=2628820 RepID=UPI001ABE8ABF|nr:MULTISPECIES: hypothetical protein [unclassified Ciceribacter]MBO3760730.1 hypothetical protein [Ciceribacter sp. L1K22]MBR0555213.1 hypothetical protein [Ciceribacter sp. L1K23]
MKRFLIAMSMISAAAVPAFSATVTNSGSAPVVLVVVEGGNRMEVALDAGQTETICPAGCFLTLPNGDRVGLEGGETVDVKDGSATVR